MKHRECGLKSKDLRLDRQILIQSVCETMVPKLVAEDIPLLFSLLSDVFPGVQYMRGEMTALREELKKVCTEMYLTYGDGDDVGSTWVEKVRRASEYSTLGMERLLVWLIRIKFL